MPSVKVISTGNELVAAGDPMEDHQIRMSNGPAVVAMLQTHGYTNCVHDHLIDDIDVLRERLNVHLQKSDVLILSGGVSMGKADFVPSVLTSLGVNVIFHKISQRPGKPMWFGIGPGNQAVFALPGNPVSTLVCCRQYVIPALARASTAPISSTSPTIAVLGSDFQFAPKLTCFQPVSVASDSAGRLMAEPVPTNTSGDFAALSGTNGYIELPLESDDFPAGSAWRLHRWDSL
jgi:molybdopterin molybdotransferase